MPSNSMSNQRQELHNTTPPTHPNSTQKYHSQKKYYFTQQTKKYGYTLIDFLADVSIVGKLCPIRATQKALAYFSNVVF